MTALASTTDYEDITGQNLDKAEIRRVERLLELASEAVLARAHGQAILQATYEDQALRPHRGLVYLPQRPVASITEVVVDGDVIDPDDYRFEPGGDGRPALLIKVGSDGYDTYWSGHTVTVTYVAGWDPAPAQIISAVVTTAKGVYQGSASGVIAATAEGAMVETYPSNTLALLAMKLPPATQKVIDDLCKVRPPGSVATQRDW